jgi:predicted nuclease of predicted toxin-antitoxin system
LQSAPDSQVFDLAAGEDRILISADTDFGILLALLEEVRPSVILLRRGPKKPLLQLQVLLGNLSAIEEFALKGSIVVIEVHRIRVRLLPIEGYSEARMVRARASKSLKKLAAANVSSSLRVCYSFPFA